MAETYLHFTAVLSSLTKNGFKLNKEGRSLYDKDWDKDKLSLIGSTICHCYLSYDDFQAVEYTIQQSIGILPLVPIKVNLHTQTGKPFIDFKLSEIIDYKILKSLIGGKRFIINTINDYVQFKAVSSVSVNQSFNNRDLIRNIHKEYELLGIKSDDGPGYLSDYDIPFINYMQYLFDYYYKQGCIKKKLGYRLKVCPKHKRTGTFYSEYNAFYCEKCKDYIQ